MTMSAPLRVVFMGTPDFAVPALAALHQAGHHIVAVYTRPPAPKGRGQQVQESPVHVWAAAHNIPVYTPLSLKKSVAAQEEFAALAPDVAVVAAYGLILPRAVLDAPRWGCLNIHASLLPRWRGASPIQHAILSGDSETGVTIMHMEEGLDTGPMIVAGRVTIASDTTAATLHDALMDQGAELIVSVLSDLAAGRDVARVPQPETGVTYAPLLKKEDGILDWSSAAIDLDRRIRALTPWPGTITKTHEGAVLKILAAHVDDGGGPATAAPGTILDREGRIVCGGDSVLVLDQVQTQNGKRMSFADWINGGHGRVGDRFS